MSIKENLKEQIREIIKKTKSESDLDALLMGLSPVCWPTTILNQSQEGQ